MGTRTEILTYLEKHPFASAEDLAQLLNKTRANIQYHLKQLENSLLIHQVTPKHKYIDRGRPRLYYALMQAERPNNLVQLAHALLNVNRAVFVSDQDLLKRIAHEILPGLGNISSETARLNRLIKELSGRGYQARWEAHAAGPEILFRNCPYASILPEHPELCQIDSFLLEENLGRPYIQLARIHLPGIPACRFTKA